jgi:hypothetical protein
MMHAPSPAPDDGGCPSQLAAVRAISAGTWVVARPSATPPLLPAGLYRCRSFMSRLSFLVVLACCCTMGLPPVCNPLLDIWLIHG